MNNNIKEKARELCANKGSVLYITEFGSHLYGTNTKSSDKDYKGLFLPYKENLLLQQKCNSVRYTTGDSDSKNSSDDVDIQLWSLHYWLELLKKGDTNAIDLLFSMYSDHNDKFFDHRFRHILQHYEPIELLDVKNNKAYVSYAYSQAKKYGLKGSRLAKLKEIITWFKEDLKGYDFAETRLKDILPKLIKSFFDESLCFMKKIGDVEILFILGKGYDPNIKLQEMFIRLNENYDKYGERAKLAEENKGIDWKAVSHAVRCLDQVYELASTGFISYPLQTREEIKEIKLGRKSWSETEEIIVTKLETVDNLLKEMKENKNVADIHRSILLRMYGGSLDLRRP